MVPLIIVSFSLLVFYLIRFLTQEDHTVYDYLNDIKSGSISKRWQSAFELSKMLSKANLVPDDQRFISEMISAYQNSGQDDDRIKQYLALAMGKTGKKDFIAPLHKDLQSESEDNLKVIIHALGLLKDSQVVPELTRIAQHPDAKIRLESVIALGNIGDASSIATLKPMLNDDEPNVRWDAAIALAKMGDGSGKSIILKLLDRKYLEQFKEVDKDEQSHAMLVAIKAAGILNDPLLDSALEVLSNTDSDLLIRNAAIDALIL